MAAPQFQAACMVHNLFIKSRDQQHAWVSMTSGFGQEKRTKTLGTCNMRCDFVDQQLTLLLRAYSEHGHGLAQLASDPKELQSKLLIDASTADQPVPCATTCRCNPADQQARKLCKVWLHHSHLHAAITCGCFPETACNTNNAQLKESPWLPTGAPGKACSLGNQCLCCCSLQPCSQQPCHVTPQHPGRKAGAFCYQQQLQEALRGSVAAGGMRVGMQCRTTWQG
jgi:hypothetical protein